MIPYIRPETYPVEPYSVGKGGAMLDYAIGFRAYLGTSDLGLFENRALAHSAIEVALGATPQPIGPLSPRKSRQRRNQAA